MNRNVTGLSSLINNYHYNNTLSSNHSATLIKNNYYDILSRNLDAHLAEADIESFRTEDIHAILNGLPTIYSDFEVILTHFQNF